MLLRDHFRPPLATLRHWESFHAAWATTLMRTLNRTLPPSCFAEAQVHVGSQAEIDVATFEQPTTAHGNGSVAVAAYAPPAATMVLPAVFPDTIEVQVFHTEGGATLVGAIELVSPGNKDRPETRRAFAAKCSAYLQQGIGLIVVDIVTTRTANLHDEIVGLFDLPTAFRFPVAAPLYAIAYRPQRHEAGDQTEVWPLPLQLGEPLPTLPLALRGVATVPIDLDATYAATCADCRL